MIVCGCCIVMAVCAVFNAIHTAEIARLAGEITDAVEGVNATIGGVNDIIEHIGTILDRIVNFPRSLFGR